MIARETELTRWELVDVDPTDVYKSIRNDAILLWWTPIEELRAYVLNIFAPAGQIFWDFAPYEAFSSGGFAYMQERLNKEQTRSALNDAILEAGAERQSDFARELLGGFTRHFGDAYEPKSSVLPPFLSAHRHMSIAVPDSCRPAVSRYFRRQVEVFGESSTRPCNQNISLVLTGVPSGPSLQQLLSGTVGAMSNAELHASLSMVRSGADALLLDDQTNFKFTGNAGVSLSPRGARANNERLAAFEEIVRFRVDLAVRYFALPVIESVRSGLRDAQWDAFELANLREELRGKLCPQLCHYPIVDTNPFVCEPIE